MWSSTRRAGRENLSRSWERYFLTSCWTEKLHTTFRTSDWAIRFSRPFHKNNQVRTTYENKNIFHFWGRRRRTLHLLEIAEWQDQERCRESKVAGRRR